jgi:hypothetical protein
MNDKESRIVPFTNPLVRREESLQTGLEVSSIEKALEKFDVRMFSDLSRKSGKDIATISKIERIADDFEKKLEKQRKERFQTHSAVMKNKAVTPLEIIIKETPLKQWYTTGKTLGNLASIGAKVALQLLKNKNSEKLFRRLRIYEIDLVRLRIQRKY